jgi:uracil-DNA glycosylase
VVKHYRRWLHKELALVRLRLVVALGNTALLGLTGEPLSVMKSRGSLPLADFPGYATLRPSYLLHLPDERLSRPPTGSSATTSIAPGCWRARRHQTSAAAKRQ